MKEKALKKRDFFLIFLHHPVFEHTFSVLEHPFPVLERPFPVSEHHFPVLERPFSVLERLFPGFWGVILSRDVPGQKSLSRDICSCPCPGTKGQRDKLKTLPRDRTGRDSQNSGRDGPGQPKSGTGQSKRGRSKMGK